MTRWHLLQIVLLSIAVALATAAFGWYSVPILGLLWGVISREQDRAALAYSLAGGLGWAVLLVWTAAKGSLPVLADRTAGVLGVGGPVLYAVTILFAVAVAWGSAAVGEPLGKRMREKP